MLEQSQRAAISKILQLALPAPEPDEIRVDYPAWYSPTLAGNVGPGWVQVIGRVADDIDSISLVASDGTTAEAQIENGLYFARVEVGEDVELFDERLRWSAHGVDHEAQVDLLDEDTEAETCARQGPECTRLQMEQLAGEAQIPAELDAAQQVLAENVDDPWMAQTIATGVAAVLADGAVTNAEWLDARQDYVACMAANGIRLSLTGDGLSGSSSGSSIGAAGMQPEIPGCDGPFALVGEARDYLDALVRVLEE